MKLYLSSYRIPDPQAFFDFVGKAPREIKLGLILNAHDDKPPEKRLEKRNELIDYFSKFGFAVEEIDLLDYNDKQEELRKKLKQFDVVWLNGGNTYFLRWAFAQSNSETVLRDALNEGIICAGDSAGAIVVGPTLKYFDTADDPSGLPRVTYEGLNFIDFVILPHWDSLKFHDILQKTKEGLETDGFKTIVLTDSAFLLLENGSVLN